MSGAAKNALDWGTRGADGGNLFADKAAAIVTAGGGIGGLRSEGHFRQSAVFLDLHVMNFPDLAAKIFQEPSPFNLETGDLVGDMETKRIAEVVQALHAWNARVSKK